jgi:hypothetical protein
MNKDGRINFRLFYVNDAHGYGYEVFDTTTDEILKRQVGFNRPEESRKAGFEASKEIIHQLEGEQE